jgi:hypothetical protein
LKNGALDLRGGDRAMIAYMEAQREATFPLGSQESHGDRTGHLVGCFIQKTSLTHGDVTSEIIHTWDDEVGEPLGREYATCPSL